MQYITRKGHFDAGHRIMNERLQCFNLHGHTYLYELNFSFKKMKKIGYEIDFKEIKRVGIEWIEDMLDHSMILNPHDKKVINTTHDIGGKLWLMSLNGINEYCNPSVENIAKEIFLAMEFLFQDHDSLKMHYIRLYETPNCFTDCFGSSICNIIYLFYSYYAANIIYSTILLFLFYCTL